MSQVHRVTLALLAQLVSGTQALKGSQDLKDQQVLQGTKVQLDRRVRKVTLAPVVRKVALDRKGLPVLKGRLGRLVHKVRQALKGTRVSQVQLVQLGLGSQVLLAHKV